MDTKLVFSTLLITVEFIIFSAAVNTWDYSKPYPPGCVPIAIHDFDFTKPWPENRLPKGCYRYDGAVYCYRLSHHLTRNHTYASWQCKCNDGQLAITMTKEIWYNIGNDLFNNGSIINHNPNAKLWLGPISRHNLPNQLVDINNNLVNITKYPFWSSVGPSKDPIEDHCSYASYSGKNVFTYPIKCFYREWLYFLCEYKLTCSFINLRKQLPEAEFRYGHSKKCVPPSSDIRDNTTLTVTCSTGFVHVGPTEIKCNLGNWTELPQCLPGCPLPRQRAGSTIWLMQSQSHFRYNEKVLFLCNEGYVTGEGDASKHFLLTCRNNGQWSEPDQDCYLERKSQVITKYINEISMPMTLPCPEWKQKKFDMSLIWFHDYEGVKEGKGFHIQPENGSLVMQHANENTIGYYFCAFINSTLKTVDVSADMYYLAVGDTKCNQITYKNISSFTGNYTTIPCITKFFNVNVVWKKNGKVIRSTERHHILANGNLFFKSLDEQDSGTYECQSRNAETHCSKTEIHELNVKEIVSHPCDSDVSSSKYNVNYLLATQPWLVTIWHVDEIVPTCYGTIITHNWIISTASCLDRFRRLKVKNLRVELRSEEKTSLLVQELKFHPQFKRGYPNNDLALIKIPQVQFTTDFLPACISNVSLLTKNKECEPKNITGVVSGLGSLDIDSEDELKFRTESLRMVNSSVCKEAGENRFSEGMFCADGVLGSKFASDSGSPFVVVSNGRVMLIGTQSWGQREMKLGKYDFFVNVTHNFEWINSIC